MNVPLEAAIVQLEATRRRLLGEPRPGVIAVIVAAGPAEVAVALPLHPGDETAAAGERARRVAAAAAGALVTAASLPMPTSGAAVEVEAGDCAGLLTLVLDVDDPEAVAELLELALEEQSRALDRVGLTAFPVRATLPLRPLERPDWLWTAELAARLGAAPGAARLPADVAAAIDVLAATRPAAPPSGVGSPHTDPVPARRVLRRILLRLDGMGKYGAFHTEFRHLARGFAGDERALALAAGEALLRAGLLAEKPSVGQRHVSLVAARTAEIRRLLDAGQTEAPTLRAFLAANP